MLELAHPGPTEAVARVLRRRRPQVTVQQIAVLEADGVLVLQRVEQIAELENRKQRQDRRGEAKPAQ